MGRARRGTLVALLAMSVGLFAQWAQAELKFPALSGTIRDHTTKVRRPFIRFFACEQDLSNEPMDAPLPDEVVRGDEPFRVVGAMAGG